MELFGELNDERGDHGAGFLESSGWQSFFNAVATMVSG
jgi:hypothetical protein